MKVGTLKATLSVAEGLSPVINGIFLSLPCKKQRSVEWLILVAIMIKKRRVIQRTVTVPGAEPKSPCFIAFPSTTLVLAVR